MRREQFGINHERQTLGDDGPTYIFMRIFIYKSSGLQ